MAARGKPSTAAVLGPAPQAKRSRGRRPEPARQSAERGAHRPALVLTTVGSRKAATALARVLLEARVCACVSILPGVASSYWWRGTRHDDRELLLLLKTTRGSLPALRKALLRAHPYDVPELLEIGVRSAGAAYARWLRGETRG